MIMNKKGEVIIFSIVAGILILASFIILKNNIDESRIVHYVGDSSTNLAYNLESSNPNCNLNNIAILKNNIVLFSNYEEVISKGFEVDQNCY